MPGFRACPSGMSDAEWQVIEPTLPPPAGKAWKGGPPAGYCRRDIVDAIRYLVKEGIQWRAMPCAIRRSGICSTTCWAWWEKRHDRDGA